MHSSTQPDEAPPAGLLALPGVETVRRADGAQWGDPAHSAAADAAARAGLAADHGLPRARLVLSGPQRRALVCRRTGTILLGGAGLNVGLAQTGLRGLPEMVPPAPAPAPAPPRLGGARRTLWALGARLFGAELPRVYRIEGDGAPHRFLVGRGRALAVEGGGLGALAAMVRGGGRVAMTIEPADAPPETSEAPAALLGAAAAPSGGGPEGWRLDAGGWPLTVPEGASFARIASVSGVALAARLFGGAAMVIEEGGARLAPVLEGADAAPADAA
ncbi:hypothetical protein BCF33_2793 [Hasllibacter halocynthiae]|uniref:Uncharacterized protein n=1 Tax=Hasllibacter halocynthiae TaxID=595589 RepID=A0A2T0WZ01_9RHOB|nr:hypothetical protein [Hasllibacter halocynthiae]PRY91911.1 hypothetical protein BCF33_2793 [Hasllibacter halocynthiae]